MTNPYRNLPDLNYWSRSVAMAHAGGIDPCTSAVQISPREKVATMGSCFAQHISRHISISGLNYYVSEDAPKGLSAEEARQRNFGVFSARYGNIYTTRQALQLFKRAFCNITPNETAWPLHGGFVDPYRPQIEPSPLGSAEEVRQSADDHLRYVRDLFENADWLVFTLGLTEAWRSKIDGSVFPLAPGVAGGVFDPGQHEFINFTASEVRDDLAELIGRIKSINSRIRFILTVSPVPLIATYEQRHVLSSTMFSKSALRVAADEIERRFKNVYYFPSYEIITAPTEGGRYFADDLRQVTATGVRHVMRVFHKHFIAGEDSPDVVCADPFTYASPGASGVVCDEETIERARVEGRAAAE